MRLDSDDRETVLAAWRSFRQAAGRNPPSMAEGAAALGVPAGAVAEARRLAGEVVPLLRPPGDAGHVALLAELGALGVLRAETANTGCRHATTGVYPAATLHGGMAQTLGDIELRLFPEHWAAVYAITDGDAETPLRALLAVDAHGTTVHAATATEGTDAAAFEAFVDRWADPLAPRRPLAPPKDTARLRDVAPAVDRDTLLAGWRALEHSHAFHALLQRLGLEQIQAMIMAEGVFTRPVRIDGVIAALHRAAGRGLPVMLFTGNRGCVQIHNGCLNAVGVQTGEVRIDDPGLAFRLDTGRVHPAWIVRKPSLRGDIHSLELVDEAGSLMCQVFGARSPGAPQRPDWRVLVEEIAGEFGA